MATSPGLDKFIEMDILEFLDRKKGVSEGEVSASEAYYDDVKSALLEENVSKALDVIERAADDYNKIKDSDPYKDIAYNRFVEAIQLLEEYKGKGFDELEGVLKKIEESGIHNAKPLKINIFEERKRSRERKAFEEKEKEYESKEEIKNKMNRVMHELFINIRKKDLAASVNSYKSLRSLFHQFPSRFIDEKKEAYNDLLSYYIQIKKLKKEIQQKKSGSAASASAESHDDVNKKKYLNPSTINNIIKGIREDVKGKDFAGAKEKIIELKHLASNIPEDQKHVRALFESKVSAISQKVELAKRRWEHSQQE